MVLLARVRAGAWMAAGLTATRIKVHPAAVLGFGGILIVSLTPRQPHKNAERE